MYLLTPTQQCFLAQSCIYHGFTGKVSTLTHFSLKEGCKDYTFLDQALTGFEHGLDSVPTGTINTSELDVSFDEADTIPSSVSSWFLCSISNISDHSRPHLAPSMNSCKLWCQIKAPISQAGKMSASGVNSLFFQSSRSIWIPGFIVT